SPWGLPAEAGVVENRPHGSTESEVYLTFQPDSQDRLEPWIADESEFKEPVTPDHKTLMACSIMSRSSRFAAALRADIDMISARHLHGPTVGTKSWPAIELRADQPS